MTSEDKKDQIKNPMTAGEVTAAWLEPQDGRIASDKNGNPVFIGTQLASNDLPYRPIMEVSRVDGTILYLMELYDPFADEVPCQSAQLPETNWVVAKTPFGL